MPTLHQLARTLTSSICVKLILSPLWLWCVLACSCSASYALVRYQFDVWNTDNGLPQNSVLAILQTRDGYLWFTTSGGLVRYNGVRLTVFDKRNSRGLNSNRFTTLFEDRRGCLWIGTEDGGMTRYEGGAFTTYTTADGLPGNWVMAVRDDQEGNLWILTDRGIVQRKNERFIPYKLNDGSPLDLYAFREQGRGGISFYDSAGLHRLVQGHYLTYTPSHGLPSLKITSAFEDQRGDLWIGTKDAGLSRLQNG